MDIYNRKFIASSKLFWGYTQIYDIRLYSNFEEIIKNFHNSLLKTLKDNNLEVLYEECEKCKFHCHTHTFEEVLLNLDNKDIYLCDHC
tara:strand:- start:85 stop:348 length:264 start_codon:yes stop_codon:yes gene_type:complete